MTNTWYWLPGFKGTKQTSTVMKSTALLGPSIMMTQKMLLRLFLYYDQNGNKKWRNLGSHLWTSKIQYGRPRAGSKCAVVQRGWGSCSRTLSRNIKLILRGPPGGPEIRRPPSNAGDIQCLVGELRSHMPCSTAKTTTTKHADSMFQLGVFPETAVRVLPLASVWCLTCLVRQR